MSAPPVRPDDAAVCPDCGGEAFVLSPANDTWLCEICHAEPAMPPDGAVCPMCRGNELVYYGAKQVWVCATHDAPAVLGDEQVNGSKPRTSRALELLIDMEEISDEPPRMIVDPLAAEGYLTLLPGKRGSYKSFLTMALAACCHQGGGELAGMHCEHVNALLVDAENGPRLLKQRELACGIPLDGLLVADGTRLKLPRDLQLLRELIEETEGKFVVLDALRRLTPGLDEDSSKEMAPVIAGIAQIARDLQAAIVLLHHQSSKPKAPPSRGSSAIEDQVDAVMRLQRSPDGKLKLWTGPDPKYRWAEEPDPVWVKFGHVGGLLALGKCDPGPGDAEEDAGGPTPREIVSAALLSYMRREGAKEQEQLLKGELAPCSSWTKADLARGIDRDPRDGTVRNALLELERAGQVIQGADKRWQLPIPADQRKQ